MTFTTPHTWTDGELVRASVFNTDLRDNMNYLYSIAVRKTADESLVDSTTLQADDDLKFSMGQSETWIWRCAFFYTSTSGEGGYFQPQPPTADSGAFGAISMNPSSSQPRFETFLTYGASQQVQFDAAGTDLGVLLASGIVVNTTSSNLFVINWTNLSSLGSPTLTVKAGSSLYAERVA